jgi:hypothetical protein
MEDQGGSMMTQLQKLGDDPTNDSEEIQVMQQ